MNLKSGQMEVQSLLWASFPTKHLLFDPVQKYATINFRQVLTKMAWKFSGTNRGLSKKVPEHCLFALPKGWGLLNIDISIPFPSGTLHPQASSSFNKYFSKTVFINWSWISNEVTEMLKQLVVCMYVCMYTKSLTWCKLRLACNNQTVHIQGLGPGRAMFRSAGISASEII